MSVDGLSVVEVKRRVRERDGHRCTECGMTDEEHQATYGRSLDVHRLVPGTPYTVDGTVTLCKSCHGPKPRSPAGTVNAGMIRVDRGLYRQLQILAERNNRALAREIRPVITRYLEENGLWPPPGE